MKPDIQIVQEQYTAGTTFRLKGSDIIFYLMSIDWTSHKIEYRRKSSSGYGEVFKGSISDIQMTNEASSAWRNIKIDKLLNI